jgi:hypothetical protein
MQEKFGRSWCEVDAQPYEEVVEKLVELLWVVKNWPRFIASLEKMYKFTIQAHPNRIYVSDSKDFGAFILCKLNISTVKSPLGVLDHVYCLALRIF